MTVPGMPVTNSLSWLPIDRASLPRWIDPVAVRVPGYSRVGNDSSLEPSPVSSRAYHRTVSFERPGQLVLSTSCAGRGFARGKLSVPGGLRLLVLVRVVRDCEYHD